MAQSTLQQSEEVDVRKDQSEEDIRIVLIGKTGSGKSKSGNTILGRKQFESNTSADSITSNCEYKIEERFGLKVMVIDTPGFFDTRKGNMAIIRELVQCVGLSSPGVHVFVYVLAIERLTPEVRESINLMQMVFGPKVLNFTIVLFTKLDDLMADAKAATIEEELDSYIKNSNKQLQDLIKACNKRYIAFDNRGEEQKKNEYAKHFLEMAQKLKYENGEGFYTNDLFAKAQDIFQQELKKKRSEIEKKFKRQIQKVEVKLKKEKNEEERKKLVEEITILEKKRSSEVSDPYFREQTRSDIKIDTSSVFIQLLKIVRSHISSLLDIFRS